MKIPGYRNGLWLVLLFSVLHSCSIEKRHYRPGYFTGWTKKQRRESAAIIPVEKDAIGPVAGQEQPASAPRNADHSALPVSRNMACQQVPSKKTIVPKATPELRPAPQKKIPAPENPSPDEGKVTNRYSTLALGFAILAVVALLSLFIFHAGIFVLAAIFAPLAFIFGLIALRQIRREPEKYKHKWYAWAGIGAGLPLFLFMVILIVEFVRFFFFI